MPTLSPEVTWSQRSSPSDPTRNIIYLTIVVADVPEDKLTLNLTSTKLSYKATTVKGQEYAVEIDFFEEIDPAESRHLHSGRATDCVIRKKEVKQEFWPRLTKEKIKYHWLKTDFDKWVDEDEQDGPAPEPEFDPNMMSQFGGGDDAAGGFGGIDFSKLGGGADLSGMGGGPPGFGGPGLEDDSDDDDMPDLEGDNVKGDQMAIDNEPPKGDKGKGKIEELD